MKKLALVAALFLPIQANALVLYVSPKGNDVNQGTKAAPLATLQGANTRLNQLKPKETVVVSIQAGTYYQESTVNWTYSSPTYNTTIVGQGSTLTVFNGRGHEGDWLKVKTALGTKANLLIRNLKVHRYAQGVSVQGDREDFTKGYISGVHLSGIHFDRIGSAWSDGEAYGAVRLVNTRDSSVRNSKFTYIQNDTNPVLLHAVYIAHGSVRNLIEGNNLSVVSGDPFRTRDASDDNIIQSNTVTRSGVAGIYSEWYCTSGCSKSTRECPSQGNIFRYNTVDRTAPLFYLYGADNYCGTLTDKRVRTAKNVIK